MNKRQATDTEDIFTEASIFGRKAVKGNKRPRLGLTKEALTNIVDKNSWWGLCRWEENVPASMKKKVYRNVASAYRDLFDLPSSGTNVKKQFVTTEEGERRFVSENKDSIQINTDEEKVYKRPPGRAPNGKEWNKHAGKWEDMEETEIDVTDSSQAHSQELVWISGETRLVCDGKKCLSGKMAKNPIEGILFNNGKKDLCSSCFSSMPSRFQGSYIKKDYNDFLSWKSNVDGCADAGSVDTEVSREEPSDSIGDSLESSLIRINTVSSYSSEQDEFYSEAKATHRFRFALNCRNEMSKGEGILVLGTRHGGDVSALLNVGFSQEDIFVCNNDQTELECLKAKFPNVNTVCGDFVQVSQTRNWLGVWYDMMCTWTKDGEWDTNSMPPVFDNACVVAVTLACRQNGGDYAYHSRELTELLRDKKRVRSEKGGKLSQDACVYRGGKNGKSHMVFCLAKYERRSVRAKDFTGSFLKIPFEIFKGKFGKDESWVNMYAMQDDNLFATVTSDAGGGSFNVKFMGRFGFPLPEDDTWKPTAQEVEKYIFLPS
jgi:hypothetical protein